LDTIAAVSGKRSRPLASKPRCADYRYGNGWCKLVRLGDVHCANLRWLSGHVDIYGHINTGMQDRIWVFVASYGDGPYLRYIVYL
jgi:hypothetical protein